MRGGKKGEDYLLKCRTGVMVQLINSNLFFLDL